MDSGATLAVTVQPADRVDTKSIGHTLAEAIESLEEAELEPEEVVADKGYHSKRVVRTLTEAGLRTYISEPKRGRQRWQDQPKEQAAVYGNRRRIRGDRGKRLLRSRGELLERPFAHCYETGAMRRTHLRGHEKILKRLLIQVGACNLSLLMRTVCGIGKPKTLQDLPEGLLALIQRLWWALVRVPRRCTLQHGPGMHIGDQPIAAAA